MPTTNHAETNTERDGLFRRGFLGFPVVILSILLFQIGGIGHTESEITTVFEYEFPVAGKRMYNSHSVTFTHAKHAMEYKITCVRCHHMLEPGAIAVDESCRDCHGREVISNLRNQGATREKKVQSYLIVLHAMCIDCHKAIKTNNSQVRVPLACWQCHIRKNK
jgi:RecJ-like exonuclease